MKKSFACRYLQKNYLLYIPVVSVIDVRTYSRRMEECCLSASFSLTNCFGIINYLIILSPHHNIDTVNTCSIVKMLFYGCFLQN